MQPPTEEKGKSKTRWTKFVVEEAPYSSTFIPMPLSSQGPRLPVHPTPSPMHSTTPVFGYFTRLISIIP